MNKTILITGGAGFIGSHVVRRFVNKYPDYHIINLDSLTYAGNLENLRDVENSPNYSFEKVDIVDKHALREVFTTYNIDGIIHLAAESHVDRSISNPDQFILTNVVGTMNLLDTARDSWDGNFDGKLFYHISTDEVFGSLGKEGLFREDTPYDPKSPYSASKASSDHLVRAYGHTYGIPTIITNCSNNYGPNQFPEKLIPLIIYNIKDKKPLPVYGKGENIRDWLYVEDHAAAIDIIFHEGRRGDNYNIGGNNEWTNIDLIMLICKIMDEKLDRKPGSSAELITFVKDRPGHDLRYAIDSSKLQRETSWRPIPNFSVGLEKTIDWYLTNTHWMNNVLSGEYEKYYASMYAGR